MDAGEPTGSGVGKGLEPPVVLPNRTESPLASPLTSLTALATIATSLVVIGVLTQADVHHDWVQMSGWVYQYRTQLQWTGGVCLALYVTIAWDHTLLPVPGLAPASLFALEIGIFLGWFGLRTLLQDDVLSVVLALFLLGIGTGVLRAPRLVRALTSYVAIALVPIGAFQGALIGVDVIPGAWLGRLALIVCVVAVIIYDFRRLRAKAS